MHSLSKKLCVICIFMVRNVMFADNVAKGKHV